MQQQYRAVVWCALVCAAAVLCSAVRAEALVLRDQFPVRSGMYWNFTDSRTQQTKTWAVLGQYTRSGVGSLFVLARQGGGFLALREQWDGLYLYGEYLPEGFMEPETPVMFMPYEIDFDRPVSQTTHVRVQAAGEGGGTADQYDLRVTVSLQALEDITFEGREIRNCAVIVKKTEKKGVVTTETFKLAPSIGPVHMRIEGPGGESVFALEAYATDRAAPAKEIELAEYFPLKPGTLYEYLDSSGQSTTVKIGSREKRLGYQTVSYTEPGGDVFYLDRDERGLVSPLKYGAGMGFAFASLPPDRPPLLLPARSALGRLNHSLSYVRPSQWPSLEPMLDFYPENEIESVIVGIEDVTVPAGTYRSCIKLCLSSVNRSFSMQREKVRAGFIWLAPGVGEVKREGLSLANTYLAETPEYIYQVESRELAAVRRFDLPAAAVKADAAQQPAPPARLSAEELVWQDNSRAMFDTAVNAAPFFVRRMVRGSLADAVIERAGSGGEVSEEAVIAAVQATTPEKMQAGILAELDRMKTR